MKNNEEKQQARDIQYWIDELADMDITKENLLDWVYSMPVGPIQKMPNCPIFLYGHEAGINNAIIQIMKGSFEKNPIKVRQGTKCLFSQLKSLSNQKKLTTNRIKYNFCDEKFPEKEVKFSNGFKCVRLAVLARNPREPQEEGEQ